MLWEYKEDYSEQKLQSKIKSMRRQGSEPRTSPEYTGERSYNVTVNSSSTHAALGYREQWKIRLGQDWES